MAPTFPRRLPQEQPCLKGSGIRSKRQTRTRHNPTHFQKAQPVSHYKHSLSKLKGHSLTLLDNAGAATNNTTMD
jgi:hypothetical protein